MYDYKRELGNLLEGMTRLRDSYQSELAQCPPGRLWKTIKNDKPCYFRAYRVGKRYVRQSISNDDEMKQTLARKAFLEQNIKWLEFNIQILTRTLNRFHATGCADVIRALPRSYQSLPPNFFSGETEGEYRI